MGVPGWSRTPRANGSIDTGVSALDGAPARSFPASLRTVMAAVRQQADATGGALVTSGFLNAYVVTGAGLTELRPGIALIVKADRANTANPTLMVDGLGPLPWVDPGGVPLPAGRILPDRFYSVLLDPDVPAWRIQAGASTLDEIPGLIEAQAQAAASAAAAAEHADEAETSQEAAAASAGQAAADRVVVAAQAVQVAADRVGSEAARNEAAAQAGQSQAARAAAQTFRNQAQDYRDQAAAAASGAGIPFATYALLQANTTALLGYVYADGSRNGTYGRTVALDASTAWVRISKDTLPSVSARTAGLEALLKARIDPKWAGVDLDPHGRLRLGWRADELTVSNVGILHDRGTVKVRGPGGKSALTAALAHAGPWLAGQMDVHNRLLWGVRSGRFYTRDLDVVHERGVIEVRGPGGTPALRLVRAHAPGWANATLDPHNGVVSGRRITGEFYPPITVPGAEQAAPPPVVLNRHAMRRLAVLRWKRSIGKPVKEYIGVEGDSFSANGIRFWRDAIEGGGAGSIIGRLGDAGGGWVSFVTGSARSASGRYIMRRQSPTAGAGVGGMQTDDAHWDVSRREIGNAGPDISQVTPLLPATAGGDGRFTLSAPSDSVPLSSVKLHYLAAASCTVRYRWNGGLWIYLMLATTGGPSAVELDNLPTAPGWTLDLEVVTGSTPLHGLFLDSPNPGANFSVFAVNGSATTDWINNDSALFRQSIALLPVRIWFILLGTNDQGLGNSPDIFIANIHQMVTRLRAVDPGCDICIWLPSDNYNPDLAGQPMSGYEAKLRAYALANPSVAVLISQTFFGAARAAPGQWGAYGDDSEFEAWDGDLTHLSNDLGAAVQSQGLMDNFFN